MITRNRWTLLAIPVVVLGLLALTMGHRGVTPAIADGPQLFLDWTDGPSNWQPGVPWFPPPFCAQWHEISPDFCKDWHQVGYEDNGDGVVSVCDYIILQQAPAPPIRFHIDEVGPTVYLDCNGVIMEPADPAWDGGNPYNTQWQVLYPTAGVYDLGGWADNGNGTLDVCDFVTIPGIGDCHVKRVGCNIRVSVPPTGTDLGTWGKVKGIFSNLF
jgi:hypothetical protein